MKPIFCGNFEYNARQSDLERLFGKYGKVDRVDMKSGFAFVYMDDERDAEDAIRGLDRREFGRQGRRLRVEWTKQERGTRRSASSRRSSANLKPTKTLFVINFDPIHTRTRDLERHFDPYGKISNIRIRRNFAFIQFESLEDATKALDATNMSKLMDRVISVEYAVRDDDERRNGHSPDRRGRGSRSPQRNHDRSKSFSPYRRERGSPDYGHGPNAETRGHDRVRSPSPYQRERGSPDYGHGRNPDRRNRDRVRSPSPYQRERGSPDYGHGRNPDRRNRDRVRSPSPYQRERGSPDNGHDPNPERRSRDQVRSTSPYQQKGVSPDYGREPSPETRNQDHVKSLRSPSPQQEKGTPDYGRGPSPEARRHDRVKSPSPYQRERGSPDYQHEPSPDTMSDPRDSPVSEKFRSRSCSPLTQERS